jgi:hypothetical protein
MARITTEDQVDSEQDIRTELLEEYVEETQTVPRDHYPELYNFSGAWLYQFMPRPLEEREPEYAYVDFRLDPDGVDRTPDEVLVAISEWNSAWEAGHLRHDMFAEDLPFALRWVQRFEGHNIYLAPRASFHRYYAYAPLFHLLSRQTLERFGLPMLKKGHWPYLSYNWMVDQLLPRDFDARLSRAFAFHVWPLLNSRSAIWAFDASDPIRLLAHNLDFWLPYAQMVAESRLREFPRVAFDDDGQIELLGKMRADLPSDMKVDRPFMGGSIWLGEEDAWQATCEMVEYADSRGQLRSIIDAVQSNRVQDDFSQCWSYEREDFERKLYHKRSKVKVTFVELDNTVPVHGPESEVHENLLWEDFLALLSPKERRIVVCLRSGVTRAGKISEVLGYANHSPVSKALARIRRKALEYLES